jgi:hypothetical protein
MTNVLSVANFFLQKFRFVKNDDEGEALIINYVFFGRDFFVCLSVLLSIPSLSSELPLPNSSVFGGHVTALLSLSARVTG